MSEARVALLPQLQLSRRHLVAAAAAVLTVGAGSAAYIALTQRSPLERLREALVRLPDAAAASEFGRRYLEQHSDEADAALLFDRIVSATNAENVSSSALKQALAARIEAEFVIGDTVEVGGWTLSRTEARLYALVALTVMMA